MTTIFAEEVLALRTHWLAIEREDWEEARFAMAEVRARFERDLDLALSRGFTFIALVMMRDVIDSFVDVEPAFDMNTGTETGLLLTIQELRVLMMACDAIADTIPTETRTQQARRYRMQRVMSTIEQLLEYIAEAQP